MAEENAARRGVYIIVPSLNPSERMLDLLGELRQRQALAENAGLVEGILVVNDGSGPEYDEYFARARQEFGCQVLRHAVNLGKGRAMKTAFNYCLATYPGLAGVVTVDSDGQHAPEDVFACIRTMAESPESLVLGCRNFDEDGVPFKSRYGNKITRQVFRMLCGVRVSDTQTGLRGIPEAFMRRLMNVPGERFEFEMNMLIECRDAEVDIREVPIRTIYLDDNASSHFNPLVDAVRIYSVFLKYIFASLSSSLIDIVLFAVFVGGLDNLIPLYATPVSNIAARVFSSLYNFLFNKNLVFKGRGGAAPVVKYYILVVVQLTVSTLLVTALDVWTPVNRIIIKVIVDFVLFIINFQVQRGWVFARVKNAQRQMAE